MSANPPAGANELFVRLSKIEPPADAGEYRGWALWYDAGHYEHGIVYRETKWRGRSPSGNLIEPKDRVGDLPWLKAEIDRLEDA